MVPPGPRHVGLALEAALAPLTLVTVLGTADPEARAAAEEARTVFERVGSSPLLDRLAVVTGTSPVPATTEERSATARPPARA